MGDDRQELAFAGIARQAELVRDGEISSRELVELYLRRIQRFDGWVNAFRVVYWERVLEEADAADERRRKGEGGPLNGVPIAVKDRFDVAGDVTTFGTVAHGGPARRDSEIVRRLRAAGAPILGKTQLPELAIWGMTESRGYGVTRNPWEPDYTPGGSSGGSAAAVASGMAPAAAGSDSAGSLRAPAAACHLFGLKPQRGRISLMPEPEHWFGLSCAGCLTRNVLDTALFLDAVSGPAPGDRDVAEPPERPYVEAARTAPGSLRIALSLEPPIPASVKAPNEGATRALAETLRALGHTVEEADPDYGNMASLLVPRFLRGLHEQAGAMAVPERLERRTRVLGRIGRVMPRVAATSARRREPEHRRRVFSIFDRYDIVLTPTAARPPAEIMAIEGHGAPRALNRQWRHLPFSGAWNALGNPAASVPAAITAAGLPIGSQLVAPPNGEGTILSLAAQIEAETGWPARVPPGYS
ncbi:MAG TPA: amidase [Solirubrobacterales bacterium]